MAVSRQRHRTAGWQKCTTYAPATGEHIVPVVVEELKQLLANKVLAFASTPDQRYLLVAIQSLRPDENWYLNMEGGWLPGYVPSFYRAYPFRLLAADANNPEAKTLCVDTNSSLWKEEVGVGDLAVFDDSGELAKEMAETFEFLQKCENNRILTQQWVDQLSEAELIAPWKITWQPADQDSPQQVQGLFRIDSERLKDLSAETAKALVDTGAMGLVYAQLFSSNNLRTLQMLQKVRAGIAAKSQLAQGAQAEVNLDELFGGDEDVLKF